MSLQIATANQPKWMTWTGRVLSALPALGLIMSATMKFVGAPDVVTPFTSHFGYPLNTLIPLGIVELACTLLYLVPRTSVLGAILLTGYLGGAVATHVRVGENFIAVLVFGALLWAGLFLRDTRLRALLPLRTP